MLAILNPSPLLSRVLVLVVLLIALALLSSGLVHGAEPRYTVNNRCGVSKYTVVNRCPVASDATVQAPHLSPAPVVVYSSPLSVPQAQPSFSGQYFGGCPGGVCPTPTTFGRRR